MITICGGLHDLLAVFEESAAPVAAPAPLAPSTAQTRSGQVFA